MTNKNKKRRTPARTGEGSGGSVATKPAADAREARRERKQQAREAREAERRRMRRSALLKRAAVFGVAGIVGVGVLYWLNEAASPRDIPQAAVDAAQAAGCTTVEQPLDDPSPGLHVADGTPITYTQRPATSGQHYGGQVLPGTPDSYDEPIQSEPAVVHFLEHSGVMLYHRADGDDAVSPKVVGALDGVAADRNMTVSAPYAGLPDGTSVAFAAWNQLQTCPGTITAAQARTIADGFAEAFACTSNAPEVEAADDC